MRGLSVVLGAATALAAGAGAVAQQAPAVTDDYIPPFSAEAPQQAQSAQREPPPPPPPIILPKAVVTQTEVVSQPTRSDWDTAWPKATAQSGKVQLNCMVGVDGTLQDCSVTDETPAGLGFKEAALHLASLYRLKPATIDGRPVESRLDVTMGFNSLRISRAGPSTSP